MSIKRATIIILVLIVIGIVAYVFLHKGTPSNLPSNAGQTGSLPETVSSTATVPSFFATGIATSGTSAGFVSIVDIGPVAAYFVSTSSAAMVVRADGEIVALAGNQTTVLSTSSISDIVAASFSYDGKKIVVSSGNVNNPQTGIWDAATRSWTSLSMGIMSPAWAPSGERLAYLRDGGNGTETIAVTDFSKAKPSTAVLGAVSLQDMRLTWIDGNNLALVSRPSAYANGSALIFNIVKKTLAPIVVDRPGLETIWNVSTSSSMGLAFSTGQSQRGGHLQLISPQGDVLQNISFVTLPTKCVFAMSVVASSTSVVSTSTALKTTSTTTPTKASSTPAARNQQPETSLYCAVPRDQAALSYYDLPDAYEQHQIFTSDDLYAINITTGHIDKIFGDQAQNFDITNLSAVGNSLFFVNRYDQKLYAITIQ